MAEQKSCRYGKGNTRHRARRRDDQESGKFSEVIYMRGGRKRPESSGGTGRPDEPDTDNAGVGKKAKFGPYAGGIRAIYLEEI